MGVVIKQSIKQSLVSYLAIIIGVVNTLFIYPMVFLPKQLGLVRFILDTSTLFAPLILLGLGNILVKYFPNFKTNDNKHNGLLAFTFIVFFASAIVFILLFLCFKGNIETQLLLNNKDDLIIKFWKIIIPLTIIFGANNLLMRFTYNFKRIVVPEFANNLLIKIGIPLFALLSYFNYITFANFVLSLLFIYLLVTLILLFYLKYLKQLSFNLDFGFLKKPFLKEMGVFAGYSILGNLGNVLATRIDVFMIALLSKGELTSVGIYFIAVVICNIMIIPAKAIYAISAPIIAQAWKENNTTQIEDIYKRSSIVLLTLGVLFLVGIVTNLNDLFKIMPNGHLYNTGILVVFILGLSKIAELATSVNQQIIEFSKLYRFNFYAVLLLAILNIINNYLFIPIYNLKGAAFATLASLTLFNFAKFLFIKLKFGMQPFSKKSILVIIIGFVVYFLSTLLPQSSNVFINIVVRSFFILITFGVSVLAFNISTDITNLFNETLKRIGLLK